MLTALDARRTPGFHHHSSEAEWRDQGSTTSRLYGIPRHLETSGHTRLPTMSSPINHSSRHPGVRRWRKRGMAV